MVSVPLQLEFVFLAVQTQLHQGLGRQQPPREAVASCIEQSLLVRQRQSAPQILLGAGMPASIIAAACAASMKGPARR
jgi:hypothetical protein